MSAPEVVAELRPARGPIFVRELQPDDFLMWKPLWDGYNAFYGRSGETALCDVITNRTWARFFDAYEPLYALVAERDGELVGTVHYLLHRTTIALTSNCYLQDLFTREEARGQGVGRALINEVYRRAQLMGCARVYWQTHETNTHAMKLYDKVADKSGFIVYRKNL